MKCECHTTLNGKIIRCQDEAIVILEPKKKSGDRTLMCGSHLRLLRYKTMQLAMNKALFIFDQRLVPLKTARLRDVLDE